MASRPIASALLVALVACVGTPPERYVQYAPALAALRLRLPPAAIAAYDVGVDRWLVATPAAYAIVDVAPHAGVASPDALARVIAVERRVPKWIVLARESLSDGFVATLGEHAAADERAVIVIRQLGNQWLRCVGDVSLCKSLKRG